MLMGCLSTGWVCLIRDAFLNISIVGHILKYV